MNRTVPFENELVPLNGRILWMPTVVYLKNFEVKVVSKEKKTGTTEQVLQFID